MLVFVLVGFLAAGIGLIVKNRELAGFAGLIVGVAVYAGVNLAFAFYGSDRMHFERMIGLIFGSGIFGSIGMTVAFCASARAYPTGLLRSWRSNDLHTGGSVLEGDRIICSNATVVLQHDAKGASDNPSWLGHLVLPKGAELVAERKYTLELPKLSPCVIRVLRVQQRSGGEAVVDFRGVGPLPGADHYV
jgi:hypothetical protein